jgi:hypothetical protein
MPRNRRFNIGLNIEFTRLKVPTPANIKKRLQEVYKKDVSLSLSYSDQIPNRMYVNLFEGKSLIYTLTYSNLKDECGEFTKRQKKNTDIDLPGDLLEAVATWLDNLGHPILVRHPSDPGDQTN